MADFEGRFNGATAPVDFGAALEPGFTSLPIPSEDDSFETLEQKMVALAKIVNEGKSLAVATGYVGAATQERDPEKIAAMSYTTMKKDLYDAWRGGITLPEFDWLSNVGDSRMSDRVRKRMELRAAALNIMYHTDMPQPKHALWLAKNWAYMLPLVTAIAKVQGAKRQLVGGLDTITDYEMAEIQTCRKVCAITDRVMKKINERLRRITHSANTISTREHTIRKKMTSQDSTQSARSILGIK